MLQVIKKYWLVTYAHKDGVNNIKEERCVIKGKNIHKAVNHFYKINGAGAIIKQVDPLIIGTEETHCFKITQEDLLKAGDAFFGNDNVEA